jgi:hypothetical protein
MKRILISVLALGILGAAGFALFAWRPAIAPITAPSPASFAPSLVAQGEVLASAGYCAVCHTAAGGQPLAGGYAMATPFGTIYSTNITPDTKTGIGTRTWIMRGARRSSAACKDGSYLAIASQSARCRSEL